MLIICSNAFICFDHPQLYQTISIWKKDTSQCIYHQNFGKWDQFTNIDLLPEEINWVPRVRNDARYTLDMCPSNVFKHEPSDIAHIFIVLSPEAVRTHWSTGENSTHQTPLLWPLSTTAGTRSGSFHTQAVRSWSMKNPESSRMQWH